VLVSVEGGAEAVKFISFAWTTAALLAGRKTVTRRDWSPRWARQFHKGDLVAAYDRQPRYGGKQVATLRLTSDPYFESTASAPEEDYEAEGFAYLQERGAIVDGLEPRALWRVWHRPSTPRKMWVVRFEVISFEALSSVGARI
jgi:hypothetical protein